MRNIQHKKEAYWFYRFLSVFYDNYVNPFFWTERMRDQSLELADLNNKNLKTIDVGSGTGFTTQGIIKQIGAENITCVDQSPQQMNKAKQKHNLKGCTFKIGDAENLPVENNCFDRYVSAGSIEYWPDPQKGISEAYRVLKPGGKAVLIGPLEPQNSLARFIANIWMLFPKEEEYSDWFGQAGFINIEKKYIAPLWVKDEKYGIAISGLKPDKDKASVETLSESSNKSQEKTAPGFLKLSSRVILGSLAGFLFIPAALWGLFRRWLRNLGKNNDQQIDPLTIHQKVSLSVIALLLIIILVISF